MRLFHDPQNADYGSTVVCTSDNSHVGLWNFHTGKLVGSHSDHKVLLFYVINN